MGRNGILGCCCPCFSSGNRAPSSSDMINDFNFSDTDTEIHPSTIQHDVPSYNLVPLPPHRAFPDHANTASSAATEIHPSTIQHEVPSCKLVPLPRDRAFPDHAIGIDDQVNSVIRLLEWEDETNAAVAVILHGFGGTGKTTLADAVVAKLNIQGWNCSTVVPFQSMENFEEGQREIQNAEQAFIYIDNALVRGEHIQKLLLINSFKKLRLLLTARDEMIADVILGCGVHTHVYPVSHLLPQDAMEFLCNKMGLDGRMQIPQDHMSQIDEILKICDGVPVVLERVGAYISQTPDKDEAYRRLIEWSKNGKPFSTAEEYSIEKKGLLFDLEEIPPSAREAFLDICSFFNGWDWDKVSCIMGEEDLTSLTKLALLSKKEESENKVMVHPIILTVGRNMTTGTRFTSAHDLSQALDGNELDIGGIEGIWLQDNTSEPFYLSAKKLDSMHNSLRVLSLGDMTIVLDGQCTNEFKKIIYFQAGSIPCIPFHPTTLQDLRFLDCRLAQNNADFQLAKMSSKLKILYLNGGRFESGNAFQWIPGLKIKFNRLKILPEELGLLTGLEELDLGGCKKLVQLPKCLGDLKVLSKLSLRFCWSLKELPDSFGELRSLKYLDLNSCKTLQQLPEVFGSLSSLEELDLGFCSNLKQLPSSFSNLSSLKLLTLVSCTSLEYLPGEIRNLSALVRIQFHGSHLVSIPCRQIKLVKNFSFDWCRQLTSLPKRVIELSKLRNLDLGGWYSLERLPEGFSQLKSLADLNMSFCDSLQELSSDFHCLASLQILNLEFCHKLEGKWMDSLRQIKSLELANINKSPMLEKRWAEMVEQGESCHFAVDRGDEMRWNDVLNVENTLNKAASKLLTGECLLTNSRGEPFSLSTVPPKTLLLVFYPYHRDIAVNDMLMWKLLEDVVKHEHPLPFQMICVGKCFGELSKSIAERVIVYASVESDAHLFFRKAFNVKVSSSIYSPEFVVTEVVADEEGRKQLSNWEKITGSCVEFLLSISTVYSSLQKFAETPQESNVKLLRALFDTAESRESSIFVRNYTENIGFDQLHGKTVLLFISVDEHRVMEENPFISLKEIYSKAKRKNDMEIISIPIPAKVRGEQQWRPGCDLAGFESILRNVPWPVLRNPWLLKTQVYYFFRREWGELNPAILVVVDSNGRILNKNALPLVKKWGAEVYPFTDEKMKQLEQLDSTTSADSRDSLE